MDSSSLPDLQRAKAFNKLLARRFKDPNGKSVLWIDNQVSHNNVLIASCPFSQPRLGKKSRFVSQAVPCQRRSSEDLAVQKLSGSSGATKKLWGSSTRSASSAHCVCCTKRHKLFSASNPGTRIHLIHIPLMPTKTSPLAWIGFELHPETIFLKGHLVSDKVQHMRMWGICPCFVDLRCVCCINNRDTHTVILNCQEWQARAGREESSGWVHLSTQRADRAHHPLSLPTS